VVLHGPLQQHQARKYMNEVLVDQLPPLAQLQRVLDELAIMNPPEAAHMPGVVIEQVAELRERMLSSEDFAKISRLLVEEIFPKQEKEWKKQIARSVREGGVLTRKAWPRYTTRTRSPSFSTIQSAASAESLRRSAARVAKASGTARGSAKWVRGRSTSRFVASSRRPQKSEVEKKRSPALHCV
jgi:hypothetical protein